MRVGLRKKTEKTRVFFAARGTPPPGFSPGEEPPEPRRGTLLRFAVEKSTDPVGVSHCALRKSYRGTGLFRFVRRKSTDPLGFPVCPGEAYWAGGFSPPPAGAVPGEGVVESLSVPGGDRAPVFYDFSQN